LRRSPLLLACVLILAWVAPCGAASRTVAIKRMESASLKQGGPSAFSPRPFPHLLQIGGLPSPDTPGVREANALRSPVTGLPTVLRRAPRIPFSEDVAGKTPAAEPETIRIVAIRVDFLRDSADLETTGDGRFDLRPADEAKIPIDPPPHNRAFFEEQFEALRRYYDVQTGGAVVLEADVYPQDPDSVFHLPDTQRYGPWIFSVSSDSIQARAERFIRDSMVAADTSGAAIPWKKYQSFLIFHAGADFQGDIRQDTNFDIPSFNLGLADTSAIYLGGADSVKVNLVMVVPETVSQDDFLGALNGVMAHEFGHQLGFFDLYDVWFGLPVVGVFSLMDSGDSQFGEIANPYEEGGSVFVRGVLPASLDPFHRLVFWPDRLRLTEAAAGDTLTVPLPGVLIDNELLRVPLNLDESFVVENRPVDYNGDGIVYLRADSTTGVILGPVDADSIAGDRQGHLEYDYLLPSGGVLIWHIDEMAALDGLSSPYGGINVYPDRRGVDIEEADGIQDIGSASSEFLGGPLDPYYLGGFSRFGPGTVPDSRTNDMTETGVTIEILDSLKTTMRVRLGQPQALPGWPLLFLTSLKAREGLNRIDLDGDGIDEIVLASDASLYGFTSSSPESPEGGWSIVMGTFPDTLTEGPAVVADWPGPLGNTSLVMAHGGGVAGWFDGGGTLLGQWGDRETPVCAGPVAVGDLLVVGCGDGKVRGLYQGEIGGEAQVVWTLEAPGVGDSIISLSAGRLSPEAPVTVVGGSKDGTVFAGRTIDPYSVPEILPGWPQQVAEAAIRSLLVLRAPLRLGEEAKDLLLITSEAGRVDLRALDGAVSLSGWPRDLPDAPAGYPAVGDPDLDGILEIAVTARGGDLYLWDLSGASESAWPRSVWEPDRVKRPPTMAGPRFWDLGGDGTIEWVQLRGDGIVSVFDSEGNRKPGWPIATGAPGNDGPLRLLGPAGDERWMVSHAVSDTVGALSALPVGDPGSTPVVEDSPGCFPAPLGGAARSGIYPASLVPAPREAASFFDLAQVILHPNPVRTDALKIRYVLGAAARMDAEAFDLSGRSRAKVAWDGHAGAAGETHSWDLSGLAPGAYLVRLRAEGAGQTVTVNRMIAILR
jgi:M6 family metalloprotease-like protein